MTITLYTIQKTYSLLDAILPEIQTGSRYTRHLKLARRNHRRLGL